MARVLVVEDSPEQRLLLETRLRQNGHRVLGAGSGEEALSLLADKGAPDVAVLDVLMPGMTGLELLTRLREDPALRHVPAIFLSARVMPADIAAGERLGATYLTKPIVLNALSSAIERALVPAEADAGSW
jgi:CheY-like chemotaxis protein